MHFRGIIVTHEKGKNERISSHQHTPEQTKQKKPNISRAKLRIAEGVQWYLKVVYLHVCTDIKRSDKTWNSGWTQTLSLLT